MSDQRERLSRLRDMAWELHEFADEVLREFDAAEDEREQWQRRFRSVRGDAS